MTMENKTLAREAIALPMPNGIVGFQIFGASGRETYDASSPT
jgi:hypothetical protein